MALSYVLYTANGSTNQFDITFNYIAESHIKVYLDNVADSSFTFVNSSRIQTSTTPANGVIVKIDRDTPTNAKLIDFQDGATILESDLDTSADQNFFIATENVDAIGDCLKLDNTGVFDATSKRIINVATPTAGTDATNKTYIDTQTTSAATSATNAATSATAAATSATASQTSATASATSATASATSATAAATSATAANTAKTAAETAETNAETAETNAETAETNAETAETNAAASAVTAATQATNSSNSASTSSTQATNASNSATAAASSATAAASSATSASSSATSAQTAQTAAEAALDTFDDKFLGSKSSNPTLDNDGNALTDGALYFNTTDNVMKVYDLGNTTWKQLTPTSSQQTNIDSAVSNASNINSAVSNASNINSAVSNASNINLVAGSISNVNTVGGSIANVNTTATNIAGVNSFAERYRVGSSDPASSNDEGDLAYNSTSNTLKYYNGSSWVTIVAGSLTDIVQDSTPQLGGDLDLNGNNIDFPTTANISDCLDEDTMSSNSATKLATQQSIKAYVDTNASTAWQAVITADPSNAIAGYGYFCNTTGAGFTVTLPTSATIGDEISFIDYAGTFDSNNLTIGRNSHKIQGASADLTVATERAGFTLVYVDATQGWLLMDK